MLMPMSRLSSLAHKLLMLMLMLMFMFMLASLVRTGLTCFPPVLFFNEISTFYIHPFLSMAQCYKRRGRLSFDSDISSPEGKKICESPRSDPNVNTASDEGEDYQVLKALTMTERIASQLEMICQTLASVGNRLQRLEGIFERCSVLERSINSLQTGQSTLSEKSRIIEEKTNYIE